MQWKKINIAMKKINIAMKKDKYCNEKDKYCNNKKINIAMKGSNQWSCSQRRKQTMVFKFDQLEQPITLLWYKVFRK